MKGPRYLYRGLGDHMRLGIDVGSTTVKLIVLDDQILLCILGMNHMVECFRQSC